MRGKVTKDGNNRIVGVRRQGILSQIRQVGDDAYSPFRGKGPGFSRPTAEESTAVTA